MLLVLAACSDSPPDGGDRATIPSDTGSSRDTASWTLIGSCAPDPDRCDVDCDLKPDRGAVFLRQPDGAWLAFTDPQAALRVADAGAEVMLCPGTFRANLTLDRDLDLVAWDTGDRPVLRSAGGSVTVPIVTVAGGRTVSLVGLTLRGWCGGSGAFAGGSGDGHGRWLSGSGWSSGGSGAYGSTTTPVCIGSVGVEIEADAHVSLRHLLVSEQGGGGVAATDPASLEIRSTRLSDNQGPGLAIDGCAARVALDGLVVTGNSGPTGGGLYSSGCDLEAGPGSVIASRNVARADGGGLFLEGATLTGGPWVFDHNTAYGSGGGIALESGAVDASDLSVEGNQAYTGGGVASSGSCAVTTGAIRSNGAQIGAGVYAGAGSLALGVSVLGNDAVIEGGGIEVLGSVALSGGAVTGNQASSSYAAGAVVRPGGYLTASGTDWGAPRTDDNSPPDVYPSESEDNVEYDGVASFACTSLGCSGYP